MLPCEAPQDRKEAPAHPDWAGLPQDVLAAVLRHPTAKAHQSVRLVCKRLRGAFDDGVSRATLRLQPLLLRGERELPPAPACARTVTLDGWWLYDHQWEMVDWGPAELFGALAAWPVAPPLELDLSYNGGLFRHESSVQSFVDMLRSTMFAPGGLQVLNLQASDLHGAHMAAFAAAPQLSALRELNLNGALRQHGVAALCGALTVATHIRSLAHLDLGNNNTEGSGASHLLVACLRSSPHLSSLQHLGLSHMRIGIFAAALAAAVAGAGLRLKTLDLSHNYIYDWGAAAWAAVMAAATCLAGLEELNLRSNEIEDAGMAQVTAALQAATHMTSLRKLDLSRNPLTPATIVQLLAAAAHLAVSIECINMEGCVFFDFATRDRATMDAFAAPLLAGLQLLRLTSLDMSWCRCGMLEESVQGLCALLRGATQLSGLQNLNLTHNNWDRRFCSALIDAFSVSSHLSSLRRLELYDDDEAREISNGWTPMEWVRLLRSATHLRGLTCLRYTEIVYDEARFEALCALLELMPFIRELHLRPTPDGLGRLLEALPRAPCLPELQELSLALHPAGAGAMEFNASIPAIVSGAKEINASIPATASFLRSCTQLTSLRRLGLNLWWASEAGYDVVGEALAAARHLCSLRELRLVVGRGPSEKEWQGVWRHLAAPHLRGVAVRID